MARLFEAVHTGSHAEPPTCPDLHHYCVVSRPTRVTGGPYTRPLPYTHPAKEACLTIKCAIKLARHILTAEITSNYLVLPTEFRPGYPTTDPSDTPPQGDFTGHTWDKAQRAKHMAAGRDAIHAAGATSKAAPAKPRHLLTDGCKDCVRLRSILTAAGHKQETGGLELTGTSKRQAQGTSSRTPHPKLNSPASATKKLSDKFLSAHCFAASVNLVSLRSNS